MRYEPSAAHVVRVRYRLAEELGGAPVSRDEGPNARIRVVSVRNKLDRIVVENHPEPPGDLPRQDHRPRRVASRQKTPNEIALNILLAGLTMRMDMPAMPSG